MTPLHLNTSTVIKLLIAASAITASSAFATPTITYVPDSLAQSSIHQGPWVLHQHNEEAQYDASGILPSLSIPALQTAPPYINAGTPYVNLCNSKGHFIKNHGLNLMQPYYFPFVRNHNGILEGFFDYRPRNENEATVAAVSRDFGKTWEFVSQALELNTFCPADITDPDNLNVMVDNVVTPYGSSSANAADNGLGHAFVMSVSGVQRIYHLNRANGHIDTDQLVVHKLEGESAAHALNKLPKLGYVSPLASGGYPTLENTATATTGLIFPDAILGNLTNPADGSTIIVYVSKQLGADNTGPNAYPVAQQCGKTKFSLPNIVAGKGKAANHDITSIRVATTTDGISFTDLGTIASGLNDPKTVALNGIRWLGSGSIIPLNDGRYGMFFGAGNCLDNDSDGFHFVGYAETTNVVNGASDLLSWNIVHGFDNPIISTDTLTDPVSHQVYPANAPLVNVAGVDGLTPGQVAPFNAASYPGYVTNFFSGRVYDPQAVITDNETVSVIFAGYNTPQPSLNLGDYRSIGRIQLKFPAGYVKSPTSEDSERN
jgi:hypothetical protein